jgi:hypothetical protein
VRLQSDSATERHPRHASHPAGTRFSSWSLAAKLSSLTQRAITLGS